MCISLSAYSQNKEKENLDIYIKNILKNIERPTEELVYFVSSVSPSSYYRIDINDIPIQECFSHEKSWYPKILYSNVNNVLKKEGKQKLSYTFFPSKHETFQSNSWIEVSIKTRDQFNNDKTIFTYEPPFKEDGETSEHIGLKSYSGSFEFEASLPYKKEIDWSNAVNLQEQEGIEEELLSAFKEMMRLYAEGDLDTLLELYKPIFKAEAQSVYATKEKDYRLSYAVNWERFHPFFYKSKPTLNKDYELKFYANGRLATLEKKKKNITSYNESALSITYDKDFDKFPDGVMRKNRHVLMFNQGTTPKMEMELYLLFYKPKGSKHLKLATDIFREEKLLNPVE